MADAPTLFERELTMHDIVRRNLTVQEVQRVTPDLVRVTLAGTDLEGFSAEGPADHVKLFFPHPSTGEIVLPGGEHPERVISRDFTPLPRSTDSGLVLDIDFYTHQDPGPASTWALNAAEGDQLVVAGPRGSRGVPHGARSYVIIADETALPAASRWIASVQPGVAITLIASVSDRGAWVGDYTGAAARGATVHIVDKTASAILAAIPEITPETFVWAGGDAAVLLDVRRHFRRTLGLPKQQVAVDGYWRSGVSAWDHHAPVDPTDPD